MNAKQLDEEAVFHAARRIADPEARSAYLGQACGGDAALRVRVERLLRVVEQEADFLAVPACGVTANMPEPAERPGAAIGPYRLLEAIGEGGMGVVYVAEQHQPVRRRVALKVIKPGMDTKQVIARFETERQALAMMDHPNIAKVHDAGTTDAGRPYFVMELVRGVPITEYCDAQQLPIRERLELFVLVCRAVQHAHQKGIIHRDLKPLNILVTMHDGVPVPKVIDFGVAKATGQALTDKTLYTGFAQLVGTPMYMSPEQAELSALDIDTRSDIYALGVLLYELLTGTTPFDPETLKRAAFDEMRRIIREEEPPKPSTRISMRGETLATVSARRQADPRRLGRSLRGELDWAVMKALEKDRRRRYETAGEFAADVMRYLNDQPVEACPPSAWYRFAKWSRRNRATLVAASLVAGSLLVGLGASLAMAIRAVQAEGRTAVALGRVRDGLGEANRQRARARRAVDEMYTQVAQRWLSREGGLTPLQREFLEKALAFYEEFAREHADDPEARAEAARAAGRVGEIREQLGLSAGAMESYRRALDAFRPLAAEFPDRPEYRRGVAGTLSRIGGLQVNLGHVREAERAYREAIALGERLAQAPGLPDDRAELASSLCHLGTLLHSTGRHADGERAALRGIDLLTRLVSEFPRESPHRERLAAAEVQLGVRYIYADRISEAEVRIRHSLDLRRRLADAAPEDPRHRFALAQCYHNLGALFGLKRRAKEAVAEYRHALPIEEKLVTDHPARPLFRGLLATTLATLAKELTNLAQFDEAEQALRGSREIAEAMAAEFPDVPEYRNRVAHCSVELGRILAHRGRNREAGEAFERGIEAMRKLVMDFPEHTDFRHNLAAHCYLAAVNYATLLGPEAGDAARARELARESVEFEPKEAGFWKGLALAEYRCGDIDAALKAETEALELRNNDGYIYDWCLMALIQLARGERDEAAVWAYFMLAGQTPGRWTDRENDFNRLAAENEARLRALLPADEQAHLKQLERVWEARRAERGPSSAPTLAALDIVADQLATLDQYDAAADRFEESRRLNPGRWAAGSLASGPWFPLGVLRLRAGDTEGYRTLCTGALERFGETKDPGVAAQLARLCTAGPDSGVDPERALELGRRAVAADPDQVFNLLALGAAEYRAARYEAAVGPLTGSLGVPPPRFLQSRARVRAQAGLFLAMARHRLGQAEEARRALAEADRELAAATSGHPIHHLWCEEALARVLRREAGEMLGVPPAASKD